MQESWRESGSMLRWAARLSASQASLSVCCTSSISFRALSYLPAQRDNGQWQVFNWQGDVVDISIHEG